MSNVEVERSIEAILMVVDEPVSEIILAQVLEKTIDEVEAALAHLVTTYEIVVFPCAKSTGDGASIATLIITQPLRSLF